MLRMSEDRENPMGQAPKPISNVAIIVSGVIVVAAIWGVIALMIRSPGEANMLVITSILTMVGAAVAAFIGITNKQDIQVIHKAVNSQYSKWVKESNEAATTAATLAAERVATQERDSIAKIVREETAKLALQVKEETAAVAAAAAASALVQQSEQRATIQEVARQSTEAALHTPIPEPTAIPDNPDSASKRDPMTDAIATVDSAIQTAQTVKRELEEK